MTDKNSKAEGQTEPQTQGQMASEHLRDKEPWRVLFARRDGAGPSSQRTPSGTGVVRASWTKLLMSRPSSPMTCGMSSVTRSS